MTLSERIIARLKDLRISQADLIRASGAPQQTINSLIRGDRRSTQHLVRIATALQTTPAYLAGETDDPADGAPPVPTPALIAEQLDVVMIEEVDLAFGLGESFQDSAPRVTLVPFSRKWLREAAGNNGAQVSVARGRGDSMEPTIYNGEWCLFDRSQQHIDRQDGLWALAIGNFLMFKRVQAQLDGTFLIISDNPTTPPVRALESELHVIGRIVAVLKTK